MVAALLGAGGIVAIVGDRIAPTGGLTDGSAPSISFQRISIQPSGHLDGGGSLDLVRMQVACWAGSYAEARLLADLVRDVVEPAEGVGIGLFASSVGGTKDMDTKQWGAVDDYFIWQERN